MKKYLAIAADLLKIRITFFVTVSTAFGFICAGGGVGAELFVVCGGLFLLACGSAAFNHIQEHDTDSRMERTKNRPIPSGRISLRAAVIVAVSIALTGTAILAFTAGWLAAALGVLALFWYNGIYTPMKKKNALAVIPGSVIGALPPAVGWVAAGGAIADPKILLISFFFFIWQIPHFWLLLLVFNKDYVQGGFPTLSKRFDDRQIARLTFIWTVATGFTGLLMPLFQVVRVSYAGFGILAAAAWLVYVSVKLLSPNSDRLLFRSVFRDINYFVLFVVLFIALDKLVISL